MWKNSEEKRAAKLAKCQAQMKALEIEMNVLQTEQKISRQKEELETEKSRQLFDEPNTEPSAIKPDSDLLLELHQQVSAKDLEIEDLKGQILKLQEKLQNQPKGSVPKGLDNDSMLLLTSLQEEIKVLSTQMSIENQHLAKENSELQQKVDDAQDRLEQIIQTSQEDRYRKDKIKLINKYIYQMDLIRKTLYDFNIGRDRQSVTDAERFLELQLLEVVKGMEATLAQEMVERIQTGEEGGSVNPDLHETIETISTDNPDLDGKIYCSINPGYTWTLPYILKAKITDNGDELKTYRFLIRSEQIITYKFNK